MLDAKLKEERKQAAEMVSTWLHLLPSYIKGNWSEDASWSKNMENVQMHQCTGFI